MEEKYSLDGDYNYEELDPDNPDAVDAGDWWASIEVGDKQWTYVSHASYPGDNIRTLTYGDIRKAGLWDEFIGKGVDEDVRDDYVPDLDDFSTAFMGRIIDTMDDAESAMIESRTEDIQQIAQELLKKSTEEVFPTGSRAEQLQLRYGCSDWSDLNESFPEATIDYDAYLRAAHKHLQWLEREDQENDHHDERTVG